MGIKTQIEYIRIQKNFSLWVANPWTTYKKDYSDSDFFGIDFLSYNDLKKEVRSLGVRNPVEYMIEGRNHDNWVASPWVRYKEEYSRFGFFGQYYLPYVDLKKEIRLQGIDNNTDYLYFQKSHDDWPIFPSRIYASEYSYEDFYGRER